MQDFGWIYQACSGSGCYCRRGFYQDADKSVAPLITWGLVITKGPHKERQNLGIYRQQVLARNKVIMRWLPQRGGALDFREHCALNPGQPYPVCVSKSSWTGIWRRNLHLTARSISASMGEWANRRFRLAAG